MTIYVLQCRLFVHFCLQGANDVLTPYCMLSEDGDRFSNILLALHCIARCLIWAEVTFEML